MNFLKQLSKNYSSELPLVEIVVLALFPIVFLVINNSWTFLAPFTWTDPYFYTGYFLDLKEHFADFGISYYGSRLPWVLFGNFFYSIAPPQEANLAIRFALLYTSVFALFTTVWTLWRDRTAALIAALLLGINTAFLFSISWDYIDGIGIASILVLIASLALSLKAQRYQPYVAVAGAFCTVLIGLNILLITLVAVVLGWYAVMLLLDRPTVRRIGLSIASGAVGFVLAFIGFGIAHTHLGGGFNFLQPQIDAAQAIRAATYGHPPLTTSIWLVFTFIGVMAAGGLLALFAFQRLRKQPVSNALLYGALAAGQCLVALLIFAVLHASGKAYVLSFAYYSNYLLPFVYVAIGGALAIALGHMKQNLVLRLALSLLVVALVFAPFFSETLRPLEACPPECLESTPTALLAGLAALAFGLLVFVRRVDFLILGVMLFAVLNVGVADSRAFFYDSTVRSSLHNRSLMVYDADKALEPFNTNNEMWFWFNVQDPYGGVYVGMTGLHMWNLRLVSMDFPNVKLVAYLKPGQRIAIPSISDDEDALDQANTTLAANDLHLTRVDSVRVTRGPDAFNVLIATVGSGARLPVQTYEPLVSLKASGFVPLLGEVKPASDETIAVQTSAQPWAYAAALTIPPDLASLSSNRSGKVEIKVKVIRGPVSIGVLNKDGTLFLSQEALLTEGDVDVTLRIPQYKDASQIIVRTYDQKIEAMLELGEVRFSVRSAVTAQP